MRGPAMAVGVPGPGVPEVDPVPPVFDDSHVRAAKMPRDISSNTRPILAMAMNKRRRFLNVSRNLLKSRQLRQLRQPGPPLSADGASKESVVAIAIPSCLSSGTARPQRKIAGIIAIRHSTMEVKKTAL